MVLLIGVLLIVQGVFHVLQVRLYRKVSTSRSVAQLPKHVLPRCYEGTKAWVEAISRRIATLGFLGRLLCQISVGIGVRYKLHDIIVLVHGVHSHLREHLVTLLEPGMVECVLDIHPFIFVLYQ